MLVSGEQMKKDMANRQGVYTNNASSPKEEAFYKESTEIMC